ncbi:TP901-1 family phage major tail protein [Aquamicrobium terrae]
MQRAAISGSGIFKDAASDAAIRARFFAGEIVGWQLAVPDFGIVSGPFQITSLEYTGAHDGEVAFEMALESAGAISFAVAP